MQQVTTVAVTKPVIEGLESIGDFIAYAARVSNPGNQMNTGTSAKLLAYLARNQHWSPFEMASITMEIVTTRDIARQMLRHRSFAFQEFSQRYAEVGAEMHLRETRLQDKKNRQSSLPCPDGQLADEFTITQCEIWAEAIGAYKWALAKGIAKEQARALLPEGLTQSTLYMSGTVRSWIHYVQLRTQVGTQKEHREIADMCLIELYKILPELQDIL